ncbi:MAG: integrase core domain-containing protein, partial [Pseudomonadota bacterium]
REAKVIIERWRMHYNTVRPHTSLGYRPPAPETTVKGELASAMPWLRPDHPSPPGATMVT